MKNAGVQPSIATYLRVWISQSPLLFPLLWLPGSAPERIPVSVFFSRAALKASLRIDSHLGSTIVGHQEENPLPVPASNMRFSVISLKGS